MKATIFIAIACLVVFAQAQNANTTAIQNATLGISCSLNYTICSVVSPVYCCALVKSSSTNVTDMTICVNQTNLTVSSSKYTSKAINGTGTCLVANNSFLVKLSVAVASLGFLSLFL